MDPNDILRAQQFKKTSNKLRQHTTTDIALQQKEALQTCDLYKQQLKEALTQQDIPRVQSTQEKLFEILAKIMMLQLRAHHDEFGTIPSYLHEQLLKTYITDCTKIQLLIDHRTSSV